MPHLERRLAEGCENGMVLWRELRAMGFAGGNKHVHRWLAERRKVPARIGRRRVEDPHDAGAATDRGRNPPLPAARQLAWLLVQPVAALDATAAAVVSRIEQDGQVEIAATLARRFTALVRACGLHGRQDGAIPAAPVAALSGWLAEARAGGIGAVETFAVGLEVDGAAVRAALTEPWSSDQAER